jgi:hypothetical protein
MNHVRGVLMLLAAGFAAWKGWKIHSGTIRVDGVYGLAVLALGMAAWHLTRLRRTPDRIWTPGLWA